MKPWGNQKWILHVSIVIVLLGVVLEIILAASVDSKGVKKTLQEESMSVTRPSTEVPEILREAVNNGWLEKQAVDKIENTQTHRVEGYFISSDTTVSQDESKLAEKALQLHNVFRLIHHAPPLRWSKALEAAAKNMARRLAEQAAEIRDKIPGKDIHSATADGGVADKSDIRFRVFGMRSELALPDETYGENVIKIPSVPYHCDYGVQEAAKRWYNQGQNYSFSSPNIEKDTASFTQMVWKKSRQVGVGCAERKGLLTHDLYIVALYNPAGNSVGAVRDNVLRPGKARDVYGDIY